MRSRPRSRVLRTSGSRTTAAAPTRRGTPGRCPPSLRTSRARCRCTTRARPTGRMLALDLDPAALRDVNDGAVQHSQSFTRPESCSGRALAALGPAAAARSSPTSRRPAAATSTSCSPRRCRGSSCATSPAPWRCASPRSTRRRCPASAARSRPPGSRHKCGGWRVLSMPLEAATAAVEHPNGPEVWAALLAELAAELRQVEPAAARADSAGRGRAGRHRRPVGSPPRRPRAPRR